MEVCIKFRTEFLLKVLGFKIYILIVDIASNWNHDNKNAYGHIGRNAIHLGGTAHSWAKHIRISNFTSGIEYSNSIQTTIIGIIFDGKSGHYTIVGGDASNVFIGLIDEHTSNRAHHGISTQGHTSGIVTWGIGGPDGRLNGPDAHGTQGTHSLFDNYNSIGHETSGGARDKRPNHLKGYIRYNNTVRHSHEFNAWYIPISERPNTFGHALHLFWTDWDELFIDTINGFQVVEAIASGYKFSGERLKNFKFVEGFNEYVYPKSLYVAQLTDRLGYEPAWVASEKAQYKVFFDIIYGYEIPERNAIILTNRVPSFDDGATAALTIPENMPLGSTVGNRFKVTDPDNFRLRYTVMGDHSNDFAVNDIGQLSNKINLDYEQASTHIITLKVDDYVGGEDTIVITVTVTDVFENLAPVFSVGNNKRIRRYVTEYLPEGTKIGEPVTATDGNGDEITYSIAGRDVSKFTVDSETAQIKTKVVLVDDETLNYLTIRLIARDTNDAWSKVFYNIVVNDGDDPPNYSQDSG